MQPIGIFDSGIGGMSLFLELKRKLPQVPIIYIADTARFPYGNKSSETLFRFAEELSRFLIDQGVETILFGCNSTSSAALPFLSEKLSFPIIGVIEPAIRAITKAPYLKHVGIIGTEATIRMGKHKELLSISRPDLQLSSQACPQLAQAVEEGYQKKEYIDQLLKTYLTPLLNLNIDALLLACTHYSFLKKHITSLIPKSIPLLDPAEYCIELLMQKKHLRKDSSTKVPHDRFFTTGDTATFTQTLRKVLQFTPESIELLPKRYWT